MMIEVKQLHIKSTVSADNESGGKCDGKCFDSEHIKDEILVECRRLMRELEREARER